MKNVLVNELEEVTVEYHRGLPKVTIPLPSRKERCSFILKPISNTVGDFVEMVKNEDKGIDRVVCTGKDGTRIASSNSIQALLDDDFNLNDVRTVVNKLYEVLHVREHQVTKEKELLMELENLKQEITPLENVKNELEMVADKRSNWLAWAGLGLMSVQFGILARLTWWEYSWDIMEPVTYFVTYGTVIATYAYFVLTKEEYILNDVKNRQQLLIMHKKAKKLGADLAKYNQWQSEIHKIEYKLNKLRNPLKLHLPKKSPSVVEDKPITQPDIQKPATNVEQPTKKTDVEQ
ncbi:hypothetical protein D910_07646 [Dendroctonus ponderosae]|uniref:Calcium uniporter protein n=1 Tax=Dendroctonus ponderosae TaxID=77166 RepID=U4U8P6_DENPD|nr:hypothetical protein D910_07646 [Dendroctonus ponderosae]